MKRRKLFALLMTAAMAVSSMSMAVNVFAEEDTTEEAAESEEPAEGEPTAVTTVGPDDGTKYETSRSDSSRTIPAMTARYIL